MIHTMWTVKIEKNDSARKGKTVSLTFLQPAMKSLRLRHSLWLLEQSNSADETKVRYKDTENSSSPSLIYSSKLSSCFSY